MTVTTPLPYGPQLIISCYRKFHETEEPFILGYISTLTLAGLPPVILGNEGCQGIEGP